MSLYEEDEIISKFDDVFFNLGLRLLRDHSMWHALEDYWRKNDDRK